MSITGDWDRRISRRTLLRTGGTLAAGVVLAPALARATSWSAGGDPFSLGIASGDPTPDGVVLWTRLAPAPLTVDGGMGTQRCAVQYEVALDEQFKFPVRRGTEYAVAEWAHSVHVDVRGLLPAREYFYRFKWGAHVSPVGRTRTAPPPFFANRELKFAFVSCQNWANGYFNAYEDIVARDPEFVVHLGDYIYENYGGVAPFQQPLPAVELMTLSDYRIRHAQTKTDPDLQAAHAALPFLVTWDDHEVDNAYANLENESGQSVDVFRARRAAAYKAYYEHMPLRGSSMPSGPDMDLYRRFHWGRLATVNMIDGRQYRSGDVSGGTRRRHGYTDAEIDPSRTMLGGAQMAWLLEELSSSQAGWNVLANNKAFAPVDRNTAIDRVAFNNPTTWDGYVADRQRILDAIAARRGLNAVVITGDTHSNYVRNVPPNFNSLDGAPVATEFLGTSVSTGGDKEEPVIQWQDDSHNPHQLLRNNNRGYVECVLTPQLWATNFRIVPSVETRVHGQGSTLTSFVVESGRGGAARA
ncbi:alkaline phosphatase D family protein [Solirubrobacter sp. CPCC 204708]|uniref:Alkaline phosphatase D family protein n=1 Tax=Solirubrobacter deserti TaxID=2282478 RepID=A0ABT4RKA8_9ACTN|nr:alkaline phosphatase D family protein [Solirubrobacter deserti]MBE2319802.1 alkaline phosphatase D family protein [Solirubrobacter deserti]MDA0138715.1 alkaline phosphatase D family protein [Solirubrobacter deserti]